VPATTTPATTATAGATPIDSGTWFRQPSAWVIIGIASLIVLGIAVVALTRRSQTNGAREDDPHQANQVDLGEGAAVGQVRRRCGELSYTVCMFRRTMGV
jgi:hypothetical protein